MFLVILSGSNYSRYGSGSQQKRHELTWLSESLNVKKDVMRKDSIFFCFNYYKKNTHTILAG